MSMFYKYNSVAGRVGQSSQTTAYTPQGFVAPEKGGTEFKFMDKATRLAVVAETIIGGPSGQSVAEAKGVIPSEQGYQRVVALQKRFAAQDGLLVWQKMGRDRMGAYLTFALSTCVVAYCGKVLWDMSWPKKPVD